MKTAVILSTLLAGAQSFGITPVTQNARVSTQLKAMIPEEEMSAEQLKILEIQKKWSEARHLTREEAEKTLDEEWLPPPNKFF
mmetsp:Transcript_15041/g.41654  ORF Transcript_15041/g.41654 Transcript_15041/m.41654 type:complete len:83 (-) Transcript_15041:17-265(-)